MAVAEAEAIQETKIPLYYDRFLEEKERRLATELTYLSQAIREGDSYLGKRIDETNKRIDELRDETSKRIDEFKEDVKIRFNQSDKRADHHFYWTLGLLIPIVITVITAVIGMLIK